MRNINSSEQFQLGDRNLMETYDPELLIEEPFLFEQDLAEKNPAIKITFSLRNTSKANCYTLLPCEFTVAAFSKLLLRTTIPPAGLGSFILEPSRSQKGTYPFTSSINLLPQMNTMYSQVIVVDSSFLRIINEEIEKLPPGKRDVKLMIHIALPAIKSVEKDGLFQYGGGLMNYCTLEYPITENDWLKWLQKWGFQVTLIQVPQWMADKLTTRTREMGFLKEWEVISVGLKKLEEVKSQTLLFRGNAGNPVFTERVRSLLTNAKKRLYIAVEVIDTTFQPELIDAAKREVNVEIIVDKAQVQYLQKSKDPRGVALKQLSKHLRIRVNETLHCRVVLADETAMVGSVDLDRQGLTVHDNMAIETNEPTVIQKLEAEFNDLLRTSEYLEIETH